VIATVDTEILINAGKWVFTRVEMCDREAAYWGKNI
jgi:hypothetical protein